MFLLLLKKNIKKLKRIRIYVMMYYINTLMPSPPLPQIFPNELKL